MLEMLVSENVRVITRAAIIWSRKFKAEEPLHTNIEMSSIERPKGIYEVEDF